MENLNKNIKLDYIYKFISSIDITSAIWVLYLSFKGFSLVQIGLLESIFHGTSLLCEIPTGAMADLLGRKKTIVIGRAMAAISAIMMLMANSFWMIGLAFIISALSYNLNSGSEEALVYDTLKILDKEEEYLRINGSLNFIIEVAQGLAVLIGGILSDYSFTISYSIAIIVSLSALSIAMMFVEPEIKNETCKDYNIIKHFKACFHVMKENKRLIFMMLVFELIFTMGTTTHFYSQKYFSLMGYSRTKIAIIFVIASVCSAFAAKVAYKLEKKLGRKIIVLITMINGVMLFIIAVGNELLSIAGFVSFSALIAMLYPISSDYINKYIPSAQRATLISVQSMCFSIIMLVFFPIVGYIGDKFSLQYGFGVLALVLVILSMVMVVMSRKRIVVNTTKNGFKDKI